VRGWTISPGPDDPAMPARPEAAQPVSKKFPLPTPLEGFRMAVVRRLVLALVVGLMWAIPVSAQDVTGIVRGRVIDAGTNQPLPDVQVEVEGTRRRAFTGSDGGFIIVGVPVGTHRVRAARIGHAPTEQIITVTGGSTVAQSPCRTS